MRCSERKVAGRGRRWELAALVLGMALLTGCSGDGQSAPPAAGGQAAGTPAPAGPKYVAAAKGRIDIEGGVVRLAARRDGVIEKVLVDEGARVQTGQILAVLDTALAQHNLQLAQAELAHAERQIEPAKIRRAAAQREITRLEALAQDDLVARQELDKQRDERALAAAEIETSTASARVAARRVAVAGREIEERIVRAPGNGQIIQRQARPGNGVSTLNVTPLFLFAPDSPQIVRAELEERFVKQVAPGQVARVVVEADQQLQFPATVLRVGKVVGPRTPSDDPGERQDNRVVECVLSIDAPELLIGQRVVVKFQGRQ